MSDEQEDFDPLEAGEREIVKIEADEKLTQQARQLQARQDAFRDVADRFYMLWWNLPGSDLKSVDKNLVDLFRMFMELAPALGVSRNGIPELRECCGRKRVWKDDALTGSSSGLLVMAAVQDPVEKLGWCPGDIFRRFTRLFGVPYCEKCDRRRRRINAFFKCGS